MKNSILLTLLCVGTVNLVVAQNIFPDPGPGFAGIGITNPKSDLHIVGDTDVDIRIDPPKEKATITVKKGEIIVSNTIAGDTEDDGLKITQTNSSSSIVNQEKGTIGITTGSARISMNGSSGQVFVGLMTGLGHPETSEFNVITNKDDGIYVRCIKKDQIGLTLNMRQDEDIAIRVLAQGNTGNNFVVQKNGTVYARKYVTTLSNIPDYVFEEDYELISLDSLQMYIETEKHLPNVPSAKDYEESGVDIGEMNRVLLEKVEELTLYVLELKQEIEMLKQEEAEILKDEN